MASEEFARIRRKNLRLIKRYLSLGKYSYSMRLVAMQADMSYQYNQFYFDKELEKLWQEILEKLPRVQKKGRVYKDRVVWYDAFGLGNRGLAYIYLQALDQLGYKILYITYDGVQSTLAQIKDIVGKEENKIVYLRNADVITQYMDLMKQIVEWGAVANFLYTTPNDVVGIATFQNMPSALRRYQVNLTDHAYWLGTNAFDICIEFRDFGAYISNKYRLIAKDKIRKLPYYPTINRQSEFQGFPFKKDKNQKVIFSGGSIYKTKDKEGTFYKNITKILAANKDLIFWYAGDKKSDDFIALEQQYVDRVVFTAERSDLYQVLENIDVYLNTYPISGGLMLQYAALARKVPFTLLHDDDAYGLLLNDKNVYYKDCSKMLDDINRYLRDEDYRHELEQSMDGRVITQKSFVHNLKKLLIEDTTEYDIEFKKFDVDMYIRNYQETWSLKKCYRSIVSQKKMVVYKSYPIETVMGFASMLVEKISRWIKV